MHTEDDEAQRFGSSAACFSLINCDTAERHPDEPQHCQTDHIQSKTRTCVSDHCCERLEPAWQSQGADHCLTATSMNKAVCRPHRGMGIVSEAVRWRVAWGWGLSWHALSPDAPTAPRPARNQTSGLLFPASTQVTETTALRSAELHLLSQEVEQWGTGQEAGSLSYLHTSP